MYITWFDCHSPCETASFKRSLHSWASDSTSSLFAGKKAFSQSGLIFETFKRWKQTIWWHITWTWSVYSACSLGILKSFELSAYKWIMDYSHGTVLHLFRSLHMVIGHMHSLLVPSFAKAMPSFHMTASQRRNLHRVKLGLPAIKCNLRQVWDWSCIFLYGSKLVSCTYQLNNINNTQVVMHLTLMFWSLLEKSFSHSEKNWCIHQHDSFAMAQTSVKSGVISVPGRYTSRIDPHICIYMNQTFMCSAVCAC